LWLQAESRRCAAFTFHDEAEQVLQDDAVLTEVRVPQQRIVDCRGVNRFKALGDDNAVARGARARILVQFLRRLERLVPFDAYKVIRSARVWNFPMKLRNVSALMSGAAKTTSRNAADPAGQALTFVRRSPSARTRLPMLCAMACTHAAPTFVPTAVNTSSK
jgi:hypothetical protein